MSKLLSIITITYQAEPYIERTLKSVISQPGFEEVEYLLIDGASKDKTLEIVGQYAQSISQIISEKDTGIYDAMNKGMRLSTGKYILFMNAGDTFAAPDTLKNILTDLEKDPDILYGEAQFVSTNGEILGTRSNLTPQKLPEHASWQDFKYGMVICHQSFIAKKAIAPNFNMKYRLSSDVDWEINCLKNASKIMKTEYPIANYLMGGASVNQLKKSWKERFEVLSSHFGLFNTLINHVFIIFRGLFFAIKQKGKYW